MYRTFGYPAVPLHLFVLFQSYMDEAMSDHSIEPNSRLLAEILNGKEVVTRFSCDGHTAYHEDDGETHDGQYLMMAVRTLNAYIRIMDAVGAANHKLHATDKHLSLSLKIVSAATPTGDFYPAVVVDFEYVGLVERSIPAELQEKAWEILIAAFSKVFGVPSIASRATAPAGL